jgi:hypothetical protein
VQVPDEQFDQRGQPCRRLFGKAGSPPLEGLNAVGLAVQVAQSVQRLVAIPSWCSSFQLPEQHFQSMLCCASAGACGSLDPGR